LRIRNPNHRRHGCDIGNRRWSSINSMHIMGIVWPPIGVPIIPVVTVKPVRPGAIPAIGMPMGVVIGSIWIGLGAQGA
jgi:hypothetical protein